MNEEKGFAVVFDAGDPQGGERPRLMDEGHQRNQLLRIPLRSGLHLFRLSPDGSDGWRGQRPAGFRLHFRESGRVEKDSNLCGIASHRSEDLF